jgi:hypothetical protein
VYLPIEQEAWSSSTALVRSRWTTHLLSACICLRRRHCQRCGLHSSGRTRIENSKTDQPQFVALLRGSGQTTAGTTRSTILLLSVIQICTDTSRTLSIEVTAAYVGKDGVRRSFNHYGTIPTASPVKFGGMAMLARHNGGHNYDGPS